MHRLDEHGGGAVRIRCSNALRLSVPAVNPKTREIAERLDALEILIFREPDPKTRSAYVRRFNALWEEIT